MSIDRTQYYQRRRFLRRLSTLRLADPVRAPERVPPKAKLIVHEGKQYHAFDAHHLLAFSSPFDLGRPGAEW